IPRGGYISLRSSGTDMGTADTDADTVTITITSVQTPVTGDPALTMLEDAVMPTASIAERDRQEAVSIPDLEWQAQDGASEDSVAADSTAAVAGSTEVVVAGFMEEEVAAGFTAGKVTTMNPLSDQCEARSAHSPL
ncbi:MAG: hypothetical protein ABSE28_21490, partial [Candidatus Sulfotelmatobacter sp.]